MTKWVKDDSIGQRERWRREAVQDYLLIMINSGLREHELLKRDEKSKVMRGLRWKDVAYFKSKAGSEIIELYVEGKTGWRYMVPLRTVRYVMERCKLRCPDAGPEDYVMALPDGTLFNTFDSGVADQTTKRSSKTQLLTIQPPPLPAINGKAGSGSQIRREPRPA